MASEVLSVPEDNLWDVIRILRAGIETAYHERDSHPPIQAETVTQLAKWCDDEEAYLRRSGYFADDTD